MIGPKLDPRSYMNLILVVIAVLLAINLVAQSPQGQALYSAEAEATQQVAVAVKDVAASNLQIAEALNRVAESISEAGTKVAAGLKDRGMSSAPAASVAPAAYSESPASSASSAPAYEGTIEILK